MKRIITIMLTCVIMLIMCACNGGNVSNMSVKEHESTLYETTEIDAAINVAAQYFKNNFSGCTLTEITYAGDEISQEYINWAVRNDADDVIVLTSSFDVDSSGGDGSLTPNSTYDDWKWILIRNNGGKWRHVDHGY